MTRLPMTRPSRRAAFLALAALAAVAGCTKHAPAGASAGTSAIGTAAIGGPFRLIDQNGRTVDQSVLRGKWSAVYFGYTFCPDVCPTTLTALGEAQAKLGGRAADFQVIFVTVDPARDTPGQLKTYLSSPAFPRGTLGLTGSPAQIAAAAHAYRVFYKPTGTGAGYSVDHTSIVYLMDPKGVFSRPLDTSVPPAAIAAQITKAMDQA